MTAIMFRPPYYLILLLFSLALFSGCSVISPKKTYTPEISQAESFLNKGKYQEAAKIYLGIAAANAEQQNKFWLLAADAFIQANDSKQAKRYADNVNPAALTDVQKNHLKLVQAQINLSLGEAEKALTQLKSINPDQLDGNRLHMAYYQAEAFAYSLTGDFIQSAAALIHLGPYIHDHNSLKIHYENILKTLSPLALEDLNTKKSSKNTILAGWLDLAKIFKLDKRDFSTNLANWKKNYPQHQANNADFLADYEKKYQQYADIVAVFLPQSGPYAEAAEVIKTGLLAAYDMAKTKAGTTEKLKFYDSESGNIVNLYEKALADGAHFIIGPLEKEDVQGLAEVAELPVPVLALNHIDGLTRPNLYQFGLSPIDDAQQIALKASQDGHKNALLVVPQSEKGNRIAHYLSEYWQSLGGSMIKVKSYAEEETDFSELATSLVQSNSAQTDPANTADVIFINAYPQQARSLNPFLQANPGSQLPVYATAQVYIGESSPADADLNGITFCDIPWVFNHAYPGELSKISLEATWRQISPSYWRLLPLGIDAYNLVTRLPQLANQSYLGATGKLSVDGANRIQRELYCAKFSEATPKGLGFAGDEPAETVEPAPVPGINNNDQPIPPPPSLDNSATIPNG